MFLELVSHLRYLCLILNDVLTFGLHVDWLCHRLNKVLGILYSGSNYLTIDAPISLCYFLAYFLLIQSIFISGGALECQIYPVCILAKIHIRIPLKRPLICIKTIFFVQFDYVYNMCKVYSFLLVILLWSFNMFLRRFFSKYGFAPNSRMNWPYVRERLLRSSVIF